jgi:hypothetical protein
VFEPWPDEPEEDNPESRWGNPESKWGDPECDLPRVPEVTTEESDVDPHVFNSFWVSVAFTNVAVFGVSLGAMLWFFRGQALLVGVLAGLRTYASYRSFKNGNGNGSGNEPEDRTVSTDEADRSTDGSGADENSGVDAGPTGPDGRTSGDTPSVPTPGPSGTAKRLA